MPPLSDTMRPTGPRCVTPRVPPPAAPGGGPPVVVALPELHRLADSLPPVTDSATSGTGARAPAADQARLADALSTSNPPPSAPGTVSRQPELSRLNSWHDWVLKMGGTLIAGIAVVGLFRCLPFASAPPTVVAEQTWGTAPVAGPVAAARVANPASHSPDISPPPVFLDPNTLSAVPATSSPDAAAATSSPDAAQDVPPDQPMLAWPAAPQDRPADDNRSIPSVVTPNDNASPPELVLSRQAPVSSPAGSPDAPTPPMPPEGSAVLTALPPARDYPSTGLPGPVGRLGPDVGPSQPAEDVPTPARIDQSPGGTRLGQRQALPSATLDGHIQQVIR